jgi:FkbM family methyltransferase
MLITLESLIEKYNIQIKGILHVGAHECEELDLYETHVSRDSILWIEALPEKVEICKERYSNLNIENAIVSDKVESVTFHRSNNGQSSSILEFGLHKEYHSWVWYVDSFTAETKRLEDIMCNYNIPFNFINLDIQGTELKALKGMESYLPTIDYIYTEVNSDYVYENCSLIDEIDDYLSNFGFKRVETEWFEDCKWGDAFYIRSS